jgi:DNA-binding MarR family transcriptional regulator
MDHGVREVLRCYPRIYFACHARHRQDPRTGARLSAQRAGVLDHLDAVEGTALKDLARHMGVTPATMSVTVDRLVAEGYVLRRRDAGDGRRVRLQLSAAVARMKEAEEVLEPGRVASLLQRLTPFDRARALDGLRLLAGAADAEIASFTHRRSEAGAKGGRS